MTWLLAQLWVYGLAALLLGFALTWLLLVRSRTVRARVPMDRTHAAHARSGSTKAVGSSLDELAEEDRYAVGPGSHDADSTPPSRSAAAGREEKSPGPSVGVALEPRHADD